MGSVTIQTGNSSSFPNSHLHPDAFFSHHETKAQAVIHIIPAAWKSLLAPSKVCPPSFLLILSVNCDYKTTFLTLQNYSGSPYHQGYISHSRFPLFFKIYFPLIVDIRPLFLEVLIIIDKAKQCLWSVMLTCFRN